MFATDPLALSLAKQLIGQGSDIVVDPALGSFIYLPLMHSEQLAEQDRALKLYVPLGADSQRYAVMHRDIIARFDRFPHRNALLGRTTTAAEQAFLDDGGCAG